LNRRFTAAHKSEVFEPFFAKKNSKTYKCNRLLAVVKSFKSRRQASRIRPALSHCPEAFKLRPMEDVSNGKYHNFDEAARTKLDNPIEII
jgi:hypothetical protein